MSPRYSTASSQQPAMASDLFTGTLEILILKALSWGPRHGYAIGRWIRETTGEALTVQEGVLYPALHRLERKGLLTENWHLTDNNRQAKFYSLTARGSAHLHAEMDRWQKFSSAVNSALATR
jgi:PadR family transcriptional regulator PadR